MAALVRAYKIEEIEENPSLAESATKDCFDCDEDNPRAVKRPVCKTCGGTGQQPFAAVEIAAELKASKRAPSSDAANGQCQAKVKKKKSIKTVTDDSDLYLEY